MGFKLVRVDATEPCKIPLAVGTHFIGRGKFLDCHDHRVSRHHGLLEVTDNTVFIGSLHQNPCFIRRKLSENMTILPQNKQIELCNGDQFGLVPESYWYELIYCNETLAPPNRDYKPTTVKVEKCIVGEPSSSGSSLNVSTIHIENTGRVQLSLSQDTTLISMEAQLQTEITTSPYKRPHSEDSIETVLKKIKTEPQSNENQGVNCEKQLITNENEGINPESQGVNNENQAVNSETQTDKYAGVAGGPQDLKDRLVDVTNQTVKESSQGNTDTNIEDAIPDEGIQDSDEINKSQSEPNFKTVKTEPNIETVVTEPNNKTVKTETNNETVVAEPKIETVKTEPNIESVKTEPNIGTVKTEPSNNNVETDTNNQENVKPGPSNIQPVDAPAASPPTANAADMAAAPAPAPPPANAGPRERCKYGPQCYRVNPVHKARFCHPGDADWAADFRPAHRVLQRRGLGIRVVQRHGNIFYINANSVHFYNDHFQVQDSDGESVDHDYEF